MQREIIALMATVPQRVEAARKAIASLLPQVHELHVTIDNADGQESGQERYLRARALHDSFPGRDHLWVWSAPSWLGDGAKFDPLLRGYLHARSGLGRLILTCDDDLLYPRNYADCMWKWYFGQRAGVTLDRRNPNSKIMIGAHGYDLKPPHDDMRACRTRVRACLGGARTLFEPAHVLGTGCLAFRTDDLSPEFWNLDFQSPRNCADLHLACWAQNAGVGLFTTPKPEKWLTYLLPASAPTIWAAGNREGERQALQRGPKAWTHHGA